MTLSKWTVAWVVNVGRDPDCMASPSGNRRAMIAGRYEVKPVERSDASVLDQPT